jgi:hypothetical protein
VIIFSALRSVRLETALTVSDVTTVLLERGLPNNQVQARRDAICMFYFRALFRYQSDSGCISIVSGLDLK